MSLAPLDKSSSPWVCEEGSTRQEWEEIQTSCAFTALSMRPAPSLSPKPLFADSPLPASSQFQGGKDFDLVTLLWLSRGLWPQIRKKEKRGWESFPPRWLWTEHLQNESFSADSRHTASQHQQSSLSLEERTTICVFNNIILAFKGFWLRKRYFRTLSSNAIFMLFFKFPCSA